MCDACVAYLAAVGSPDALAVGQATMSRFLANGSVITTTGTLRLSYFTATKGETVTQIRQQTAGTAAVAPTVCRSGLYLIDPVTKAGALVASIANDVTLFVAANTLYTRPLLAPYMMIRGQRYAFSVLVVTAAATPTFCGDGITALMESKFDPRVAGALAGQADLPATYTDASLSDTGVTILADLLP